MTAYRLAHVTDPHFRSPDIKGALKGARLHDFIGKRAVGALNVVVNRRRKHKMELLEALGEDLRRERPDHVALTGDLSNVSLESEWREALRWIEGTGRAPADITVIPGNHDAYVPEVVARGTFQTLFGTYQSADLGPPDAAIGRSGATGPADEEGRATYPFVRLRGPLALIGINSCVPTGDLGAWGQVGGPQLERLEATLARRELGGKVRVVLIHHPPVQLKGGEERNLKDRAALGAVLQRAGAELVVHGHDHRDESATLTGPGDDAIPVIGAGSASYAGRPENRARYNVYEFEGTRVTRVTRVHDEDSDQFREAARVVLRA
ncbi:MAG TPA: metallophosphoesterase [Polyangia bacterium]